jgi:hypothetical protein
VIENDTIFRQPSAHHGKRLRAGSDDDGVQTATVPSVNTGTPYRPDADMHVHIFALFNENMKGCGPDGVEQHFGLFYPNMTKVYEFDLPRGELVRGLFSTVSECLREHVYDETSDLDSNKILAV